MQRIRLKLAPLFGSIGDPVRIRVTQTSRASITSHWNICVDVTDFTATVAPNAITGPDRICDKNPMLRSILHRATNFLERTTGIEAVSSNVDLSSTPGPCVEVRPSTVLYTHV